MVAPSDAVLRSLAEALADRLRVAGHMLTTAESCTAGWIAKACTDLPGSSRWFLGGVVAYSNETKSRLLSVPAAVLDAHGAVSEPVVRAMALGALEQLGGDVSVAVSGIAGPDGGTPAKPVGTVWFAWAARGTAGVHTVVAEREVFSGDRESVRRWAVHRALSGLLRR